MPRGKGIFDSGKDLNYPKFGETVRKRRLAGDSLETIAKESFNVSKQAMIKYLKLFESAATQLGDSFPTCETIVEHAKKSGFDKLDDSTFRLFAGDLISEACKDHTTIKGNLNTIMYATEWALFIKNKVTIDAGDVLSRDANTLQTEIAKLKAKIIAASKTSKNK